MEVTLYYSIFIFNIAKNKIIIKHSLIYDFLNNKSFDH